MDTGEQVGMTVINITARVLEALVGLAADVVQRGGRLAGDAALGIAEGVGRHVISPAARAAWDALRDLISEEAAGRDDGKDVMADAAPDELVSDFTYSRADFEAALAGLARESGAAKTPEQARAAAERVDGWMEKARRSLEEKGLPCDLVWKRAADGTRVAAQVRVHGEPDRVRAAVAEVVDDLGREGEAASLAMPTDTLRALNEQRADEGARRADGEPLGAGRATLDAEWTQWSEMRDQIGRAAARELGGDVAWLDVPTRGYEELRDRGGLREGAGGRAPLTGYRVMSASDLTPDHARTTRVWVRSDDLPRMRRDMERLGVSATRESGDVIPRSAGALQGAPSAGARGRGREREARA